MRVVSALLVAATAVGASPFGVVRAADGPGALVVEAAPAKISTAAGAAVVRIANDGGAPVTGVTLSVDAPAALTATMEKTDLGTMPAGGSALVKLTLAGSPGIVVVRAMGQSGDIPVSATTAIELSPMAPHSLVLVGNSRLTEHSPADLLVVVTNTSDTTVQVELSAAAGKHSAVLETESFELPPRAVEDVALTVRASGPLRRGSVGLVVRATMTGGQTQQLTATRELAVALASDELPGPLGVSSMILLPGLVALLAFFEIRSQDRKRIGAAHPGAKAVWDNKTWLLLAGGLSLLAAVAYAAIVGRDVLDSYELSDIAVETVVVGGLGAAAALVTTWTHRKTVPVITSQTSPADVLRAAQRASNSLERTRYKTAHDKHGLLVHRDGQALVLTPPIAFESGGALWDAWNKTKDPNRFGNVVAKLTPGFDGRFEPGPDDIPWPLAVEQAVEVGRGELLDYKG